VPVRLPAWTATLEQAKEWGLPPWIVETDTPVLWHLRWIAYREETVAGRKLKEQHG